MARLLIAIPTKSTDEYLTREQHCRATWLRDCPCDFKFFRDSDLGIDPSSEQCRQLRTQRMVQHALKHGYDFIFRVDSDAYVWVDRLLTSGFEQYDYVGYCLDYPPSKAYRRTAHGGSGFILSRRAMQIIANANPCKTQQGNSWYGDIWAGEQLYAHSIRCHRDTRFMPDRKLWEGTDLSQAISIHPVGEDDASLSDMPNC